MNSKARLIAIAIGALALAIAIAVWHGLSADETPAGKRPPLPRREPRGRPRPRRFPAPPSGPAAAAPNAPPDAAAPSAAVEATVARMNEAVLMAHLREVARTDSAQTIEIARAGNKKFPDSPDAPERYSILIHALITQDKLSEGRAEAEYMVNHFPDSSWVRRHRRLHRRPPPPQHPRQRRRPARVLLTLPLPPAAAPLFRCARASHVASRPGLASACVLFPARRLRCNFERQPTRRKKPTRGKGRPVEGRRRDRA